METVDEDNAAFGVRYLVNCYLHILEVVVFCFQCHLEY